MKKLNIVLASLLALTAVSAQADVANAEKLAQKYTTIAKIVNPGYAGPSAMAGKMFFNRKITNNGNEAACASCHTPNPANEASTSLPAKQFVRCHRLSTTNALMTWICLLYTSRCV